MSETDTPTRRLPVGGMSLDDRLDNIEAMLEKIMAAVHTEATEVALIKAKLDLHDKILMGVCGTVGISVLGAVLALVLRQ